MAQIRPVTSEPLEAKIRQLLPSQNGFGEDLQAQNVIVPIIDLTQAAAGSTLPLDLQTALAFGSQTQFNASGSTVQLANTPGFWRVLGTISGRTNASTSYSASLNGSDGLSTKDYWRAVFPATGVEQFFTYSIDLIVFLAAGESVSAVSSSGDVKFSGSSRQVATANGDLVNPNGYQSQ